MKTHFKHLYPPHNVHDSNKNYLAPLPIKNPGYVTGEQH